MTNETRGSANFKPMSVDELHQAIGIARSAYKVKRWIIKGIPPVFDRVDALVDISSLNQAGEIIQNLIALQTSTRQIGVVVFPYGIPKPEGVLLNLDINQSTGPG